MPALARWLLPGMAILLLVASWIRFAQVGANNRPPLRLLAMEGDEPWPELELLRIRCGFNGQFLATGDRIWIPCATGPKRWELIRWDFARGVAERRWRARHSPQNSSNVEAVEARGLAVAPVIAAALRLPRGDLALVMHGAKSVTPVELAIARREGGLTHHPLPGIKVGALVGFAAVDGRYELLTADCRRHVFEPGKPLVSVPLAGCPYDGKTVLEWSRRLKKGWHFVYARQSQAPGLYALFSVEPGSDTARPLGTLRGATKKSRGEKLDTTPGNVLPVAMSQWPTHRLIKGAPQPLPPPPKALLEGFGVVSRGGRQIYLLETNGLRRLHVWFAETAATRPSSRVRAPGQTRSHSARRWRWFVQLPTRWLAGESLGRDKGLRLEATAPNRSLTIPLSRPAPSVLGAIPAKGGGNWIFDSQGGYLRIADGLHRTDAPGLRDRFRRIWSLHHLQRNHLSGPPRRPERQSQFVGLTHRMAFPVVLLGLPVLALLLLPLGLRAGRRLDPARPLRISLIRPVWPWIVAAGIYLVCAGALLWPFWQVTTAF